MRLLNNLQIERVKAFQERLIALGVETLTSPDLNCNQKAKLMRRIDQSIERNFRDPEQAKEKMIARAVDQTKQQISN